MFKIVLFVIFVFVCKLMRGFLSFLYIVQIFLKEYLVFIIKIIYFKKAFSFNSEKSSKVLKELRRGNKFLFLLHVYNINA